MIDFSFFFNLLPQKSVSQTAPGCGRTASKAEFEWSGGSDPSLLPNQTERGAASRRASLGLLLKPLAALSNALLVLSQPPVQTAFHRVASDSDTDRRPLRCGGGEVKREAAAV